MHLTLTANLVHFSFLCTGTPPWPSSPTKVPHENFKILPFSGSAQALHRVRNRVYPHHESRCPPLLPFRYRMPLSTKMVFLFPITGHATVILHRPHSSSKRTLASKSYSFLRGLVVHPRRRSGDHLEGRFIDKPFLEPGRPQLFPHLFLMASFPQRHSLIDRGHQSQRLHLLDAPSMDLEKLRVATLHGRLPTSPGSLAHNRLSHSSVTVRNLSFKPPNTSENFKRCTSCSQTLAPFSHTSQTNWP